RAIRHQTFALFTRDIKSQSMLSAMFLFAALAGARRIVAGDAADGLVSRSRATAFLLEAPRLALELTAGYAALVPLTWLLTVILGAAQVFNRVRRSSIETCSKHSRMTGVPAHRSALYVRATLSMATEGGMVTHLAGFADGARSLGHRLRFLISGRGSDDEQDGEKVVDQGATDYIEPSTTISATRALYELWNNLVFTARSLSLTSGEKRDFEFIYQRYSRFNWTGVALSLVTGRPLFLEFNGSEVWVSKRWDPVGLIWMLRRFELLNLRAADLIFVVSEVERRNVIDQGIAPQKIIVNPNGVDADIFKPGCGGMNVRRTLGIEDRVVVGFLGTFGPWHGAPVLARATGLLGPDHNCHFLFIGDGDERAPTESIIESSGNSARATFTGRIPHASVPAYLDACDILVSPHVEAGDGTLFFGSPTKLFEYMAMARPVIASRLGQIADVIEDDVNGLLAEPGDSRAIAARIEMLADDEELRRRLGAAARDTVNERFTWRHNAARVFESVSSV
ncbi:MAG TPA: glycosyltransferase, partial [Blastocatellia bacterium]|nr:glycosyltransferase [Blastocatellia bacterium]